MSDTADTDAFETAASAYSGRDGTVAWSRDVSEDGYRCRVSVSVTEGTLYAVRVFGHQDSQKPHVSVDASGVFDSLLEWVRKDENQPDPPLQLSNEQEQALDYLRKSVGGEILPAVAWDLDDHVFVAIRGGAGIEDEIVVGVVKGDPGNYSASVEAKLPAGTLRAARAGPRL